MTKLPSQYKHKKTVLTLFFGCLSMGLCYMTLVGMTVSNVMNRQNDERQITSITADISKVEFSFLNQKSSINSSYAHNLGFVDVETSGVAKQSQVGALAQNEI